jgi:predicted outer membrane repeat protein
MKTTTTHAPARFIALTSLVLCALLAASGPLYAAAATVVDVAGLVAALGGSDNPINLEATIQLTTTLTIGRSVTINGRSNSLICTATDGVFEIDDGSTNLINVTFNDVVFQNNGTSSSRNAHGGAVSITSASSVAFNKCAFLNNHGLQGGAIYKGEGEIEVRVIASYFSGNTSGEGGAIYADKSGDLTIDHSYFEGNESDNDGGGVDFLGASLQISRSTFKANFARRIGGGGGGAVWAGNGAWCKIANSTFVENGADSGGSFGGGVHLSDSAAGGSIVYSTFADNSAINSGRGGGLYTAAPRLDVGMSIFAGNIAEFGYDIFRNDYVGSADINSAGYNIVTNFGCTSGDGLPRRNVDWHLTLAGVSSPDVGPGLSTDIAGVDNTRYKVFGTNRPGENTPASTPAALGPMDYVPAGTGSYQHPLDTLAIAATSPAKDRIIGADAEAIFGFYMIPAYPYHSDERGVRRNTVTPEPAGGYLCDIGAFEIESRGDTSVYVLMSGIPNNMARVGQFCSLSAQLVLPGEVPTSVGQFFWRSSNLEVARIDGLTGNLYTLALGKTTISVTEGLYGTTTSQDLEVTERMKFANIDADIMSGMADFNAEDKSASSQIYFADANPDDVGAFAFADKYREIFGAEPTLLTTLTGANEIVFPRQSGYGDANHQFKPAIGITTKTFLAPGALLPLTFSFNVTWEEVEEILGRSDMTFASTEDVVDIFRKSISIVFVDENGNRTTLVDGGASGIDVSAALQNKSLSFSSSGNGVTLWVDVMFADASSSERRAEMIDNKIVVADNNANGTISGELAMLKGISSYNGDSDEGNGGGGCNAGTALAALLLLVSAAALQPLCRLNKIDKGGKS